MQCNSLISHNIRWSFAIIIENEQDLHWWDRSFNSLFGTYQNKFRKIFEGDMGRSVFMGVLLVDTRNPWDGSTTDDSSVLFNETLQRGGANCADHRKMPLRSSCGRTTSARWFVPAAHSVDQRTHRICHRTCWTGERMLGFKNISTKQHAHKAADLLWAICLPVWSSLLAAERMCSIWLVPGYVKK